MQTASIVPERLERFWERVLKTGSDCWEWQGALQNTGYGVLSVRGSMQYAHRVAYSIQNGGIEEGAIICHRCDNPKCCNPGHLFAGTHKDNTADMYSKGRAAMVVDPAHAAWRNRTHCKRGHEFTDDNIYLHKDKRSGKTYRNCRICVNSLKASRKGVK